MVRNGALSGWCACQSSLKITAEGLTFATASRLAGRDERRTRGGEPGHRASRSAVLTPHTGMNLREVSSRPSSALMIGTAVGRRSA